MNVSYKELNTVDVAKALKLDKTTVAAWCRKGYINYQDVSEPGSSKPRYQIPQWEFDRIQKLIRKFGKRQWMLYNEKDKVRAAQEHMTPIEEKKVEDRGTEFMFIDRPDLAPIETPEDVEAKRILNELASGEVEPEKVSEELKPTKFNPDKVMNTILYIQEIKERLNDLEAEKAQLENELEQCRNEVMGVI